MKTSLWLKPLIYLSLFSVSPCFSGEKGKSASENLISDTIFTPSSSGKPDPAYDSSKELVMDFFTAMKQNDISMISELLAPTYKVVNYGEIAETPYSKFNEMSKNLKVRIGALHKALPDFDLKITDILADRNKVIVQGSLSGVQKGDFMGIAPTNKPIHLKFFSVFTISNNKIVLISEMWNELNVMKQLGFIVL